MHANSEGVHENGWCDRFESRCTVCPRLATVSTKTVLFNRKPGIPIRGGSVSPGGVANDGVGVTWGVAYDLLLKHQRVIQMVEVRSGSSINLVSSTDMNQTPACKHCRPVHLGNCCDQHLFFFTHLQHNSCAQLRDDCLLTSDMVK